MTDSTGKASVAPTPKQVDALCVSYEKAKSEADALGAVVKMKQAAVDVLKVELVELTQAWGIRHTEKSQRLLGLGSWAQTTVATRVTTDAAKVEDLRTYLGKQELPGVAGMLFTAHTTYSLVAGPQAVLATLQLGARVRIKLASMLGLCFSIATSAPGLKVEVAAGKMEAS
jgi:hypothetical protein